MFTNNLARSQNRDIRTLGRFPGELVRDSRSEAEEDPITLVECTAHLLNELCPWPAGHGQCFKLISFVFCDSLGM